MTATQLLFGFLSYRTGASDEADVGLVAEGALAGADDDDEEEDGGALDGGKG